MRTIPLNKGYQAIIDDDMYDAVSQYTWFVHKPSRYSKLYVRSTIWLNGKADHVYLHNLIIGKRLGFVIDHINHDPLDNRRENLRFCKQRFNVANGQKRQQENATSKYKGVSWRPNENKWSAQIMVNRKQNHLGYFDEEEDAAIVYNVAAQLFWGEYASLNPV